MIVISDTKTPLTNTETPISPSLDEITVIGCSCTQTTAIYRLTKHAPWLCLDCKPPVDERRIDECRTWNPVDHTWMALEQKSATGANLDGQNAITHIGEAFERLQVASDFGWLGDDQRMLCGPQSHKLVEYEPVDVRHIPTCKKCHKLVTSENHKCF